MSNRFKSKRKPGTERNPSALTMEITDHLRTLYARGVRPTTHRIAVRLFAGGPVSHELFTVPLEYTPATGMPPLMGPGHIPNRHAYSQMSYPVAKGIVDLWISKTGGPFATPDPRSYEATVILLYYLALGWLITQDRWQEAGLDPGFVAFFHAAEAKADRETVLAVSLGSMYATGRHPGGNADRQENV